MITADEALKKIFEYTAPLSIEVVNLDRSVGRIAAKDMFAGEDLPSFDNSAMDGYAVRAEDVADASREYPVTLSIREAVRAGSISKEKVGHGEAIKIMTGAPMPPGADTVVIKEKTLLYGDRHVRVFHCSRAGDHIRCRGEDVRSGDVILKSGAGVRPYEVALLAAQGITEIPVIRKPVVAVFATGDELVDVSESVSHGIIRNSNGPAIVSSLSRWGIDSIDMGIVSDNPEDIEAAMKTALSNADVVLVSGGVSVGDYDYTRSILTKVGFKEIFWKVAVKPGKPLLFGVYPSGYEENTQKSLVFGLPGNPVSVLVCMEEFVRPALERLQGRCPVYPGYHLYGKAKNDYPLPQDRRQYLFCRVTQEKKGFQGFQISIMRPQGSAMMGMACHANALAVSSEGKGHIRKGDTLPFRWLK